MRFIFENFWKIYCFFQNLLPNFRSICCLYRIFLTSCRKRRTRNAYKHALSIGFDHGKRDFIAFSIAQSDAFIGTRYNMIVGFKPFATENRVSMAGSVRVYKTNLTMAFYLQNIVEYSKWSSVPNISPVLPSSL